MAPVYKNRNNSRRRTRNRIKAALVGIMVLIVLLLGILICALVQPKTPATDEGGDTQTEQTKPASPTVTVSLPKDFIDRNTASQYIVLSNADTGEVIYSKNPDERCYPASTTKLLTCLVTLKYATADTVFTVGDEITMIDPQSSVAHLGRGNKLDLQTMIEAIILPSGNDAAYTAAANVGRIIKNDQTLSARDAIHAFCEQMNVLAKELGAKNSHFANPDGIHDDNHYTTAADMALIAKAALQQPLLAQVVGEEKAVRSLLVGEAGITWYNTNFLLRSDNRFKFEGATGLKTGYTGEAGYCLAASAKRNGVHLIAILMNAPNGDSRFDDAVGLFNVCFDSLD